MCPAPRRPSVRIPSAPPASPGRTRARMAQPREFRRAVTPMAAEFSLRQEILRFESRALALRGRRSYAAPGAAKVHAPRPGRRGASASDNGATFLSARVQMSLCLSTHHLRLQLSVFGSAGGALNVAPVQLQPLCWHELTGRPDGDRLGRKPSSWTRWANSVVRVLLRRRT